MPLPYSLDFQIDSFKLRELYQILRDSGIENIDSDRLEISSGFGDCLCSGECNGHPMIEITYTLNDEERAAMEQEQETRQDAVDTLKRVNGIGEKRAERLYLDHQITTLEQLQEAHQQGTVRLTPVQQNHLELLLGNNNLEAS